LDSASDVPEDSGLCGVWSSATDLVVDSTGCATTVLLLLMGTDAVDDFFPRPLPDLSDSRRGLRPEETSVAPPVALATEAG